MLDRTLLDWRRRGVLSGDEWAAARSVLRDLADAVDGSRADARAGECSWLAHARTVTLYREALAAASEGGAPRADIDAALSALLRDAPTL
jgi:hypothetical protein